ncbi:hypothetical protein GCM10022405_06940 [Gibbsiella dentisursi]|uniref:Uncharacterized protein n=1 Tax=Gibbsiella dentisursi TaxID=796890 RepID=A0ABP7KS79_9GAMM
MGVGDRQCWLAIVFGLFPHPVPLPEGEGAYDAAWVWGDRQYWRAIVFGLFPLPKGEGAYYAAWEWGIGSAGWQLCSACSLTPSLSPRERGAYYAAWV